MPNNKVDTGTIEQAAGIVRARVDEALMGAVELDVIRMARNLFSRVTHEREVANAMAGVAPSALAQAQDFDFDELARSLTSAV